MNLCRYPLARARGWMSSSIHASSKQPVSQDVMSMASMVVFLADTACASIEYVKPSVPAAVSCPLLLALVRS